MIYHDLSPLRNRQLRYHNQIWNPMYHLCRSIMKELKRNPNRLTLLNQLLTVGCGVIWGGTCWFAHQMIRDHTPFPQFKFFNGWCALPPLRPHPLMGHCLELSVVQIIPLPPVRCRPPQEKPLHHTQKTIHNNNHNAWHSIKPTHCSADLLHGSARQRHLVPHGGGIGSSSYTVAATVFIHHGGGICSSSSYAAASAAAHLSIQQAISSISFTTAASAAACTTRAWHRRRHHRQRHWRGFMVASTAVWGVSPWRGVCTTVVVPDLRQNSCGLPCVSGR